MFFTLFGVSLQHTPCLLAVAALFLRVADAAAASNACSPRRFSAIERRALDRSRTAGYHDGITYHFNYGGGNGCAQRIPQAPIFFSANGIGTLLGNIGQHGHGDEGR